ncbi:MAG TPA: VIT domain-containing protein, partial [Kofleriaceae bacterium]
RVRGIMAAIDVAQTFVNTTGTAIEATYIFPMPDRLAVNRFRMEVAGRVIEGIVDERGAAREQYDQAIAAGHRAAITEEERAGVFTLRVGNLMPGETAVIKLTLVGPLPVDDGEVTFRFPLVVAPRYMPGTSLGGDQSGVGAVEDTDLVPDASRISPPVHLPGMTNPVRLALRVAIHDRALRELVSSLHAVTTSVADAQIVEVMPGERLDRDFILRWRIDGAELASTLVCSDDADGKTGTFMLTLVPPSTKTLAGKPRDVVFVLDRSGSMGGWKMVAARRAVARMIDSLTSNDRFCALAFDDNVEAIPHAHLVPATDRERFRAVEQLAKVEARGGTEMLQPLELALALTRDGYTDRDRIVVLVTDGQVGNEDHLMRQLGDLRNTRIFTLGIDQAVNAAFLRRLASAGGGLCELVESEDRLDAVMAKVHRRIGTPVVTELSLKTSGGGELSRSELAPMTTPGKLPDVYAGAPVVIFGRYRGAAPASIELDGTTFGDAFHATVARTVTTGTDLAASWARARIRDLEDRYAIGARELEVEIVTVSKQFTVLSRFTAFLAIDRAEIANPGGRIKQVVQSVDEPAGWEQERGRMRSATGGLGQVRRNGPPPPAMPSSATLRGMIPRDAGAPRGAARAFDGAPPMGQAPPRPGPSRPSPSPASPMSNRDAKMKKAEESARSASSALPGGAAAPNGGAVSIDASVYLASLAELARALAAVPTTALRLIRQRLAQWVEDVRSVGGHDDLAAAVEKLVTRLAAAIASGAPNEPRAIADELAKLATGTTPPVPSRPAFWK